MATNKNSSVKEELVKLRSRLMPSGNSSLYLDYVKNGKRVRESLGLTLMDAQNAAQKDKNTETMLKAETIRIQREKEILSGKFLVDNDGINTPFLPYYRDMVAARHGNPESQGNWGNWRSCLGTLANFRGIM